MRQEPTMIELPLISFDQMKQKRIKNTYFSSDMFKDKMIRDWEEGGKAVSGMCVAAKQIKIKTQSDFSTLPENSNGEYWIFELSKKDMILKLSSAGYGVINIEI